MPAYLYEQVADDLRRKIKDGTYPPGSKLPSRRELCQEHGVSDIVVARAVLILKHEGLVELMNGVGMFVTE